MKDGELLQRDGRWELRFTRELTHPVEKVWTAITSQEGLSAWFPFDVVGERAAGAPLRFEFREGEGPAFEGSMVEFSPRSVMELRWEGDETLRLELAPSGAGCVLTLINRFDELGKAARDAAGWHTCLDVLDCSLAGEPQAFDSSDRWQSVHPAYVTRFGPAAATIGPPAT
jgi:uncharacterized protein YndB with AHSA1/START domain